MQASQSSRRSLTGACLFIASLWLAPLVNAARPSDENRTLAEWEARIYQAVNVDRDQRDYVTALTAIAQRWPERLSAYEPRLILRAFSNSWPAPEPGQNEMRDLLGALYAAGWKEYGVEPSLQDRYIRLLVAAGNLDKAREITRHLRSPTMTLAIKVDRRYQSLVEAEPESFDIAARAALQIADWERATRRYPRLVEVRYRLAHACLEAGEFEQAREIADQLLATIATANKPADLFDDAENLNWIYNVRASAHFGLGEWDAAEQDYKIAAGLTESGGKNVSDVLNLAAFYADSNRPEDAIRLVDPLGKRDTPLSGYGRMVQYKVRHQSALSIGDAKMMRKALAYLRKHGEDSPRLLIEELARAEQFDEAAAVLIEWLSDEESRVSALTFVQQYADLPMLPGQMQLAERLNHLLQRGDVVAAIDAVGRVERVPLPSPF